MSGYWEKRPCDVLLATPISGQEQVYYEWYTNMLDVIGSLDKGLKVVQQKFPEPNIDISRDKALTSAIQNGARWLWFLDSDVLVPPGTLERLIMHDKPIVGALYVRRHNPPFNEMLKLRTDGLPGLQPIQDGQYQPDSLVECDAIATGCMLVRTDVFEKMKPFELTVNGQKAKPAYFFWTEWRLPVGASEDFAFCMRAREAGIPIYCDTSIKARHLGPVKFKPSGNNTIAIEFPGELMW